MPTYTFRNKETGEEVTELMSLSEREDFLASHPGWDQAPATALLVSGVGGVLSKTPDSWKDVLKGIKKSSGKGNTINT